MKTKIILFFVVVILFSVSCKDDKVAPVTLPKFEGVTYIDNNGNIVGSVDTTDWRIDDKFTELERNLFDTLKFDRTLSLKSNLKKTFGVVPVSDSIIHFYPNPVSERGNFKFNSAFIVNIVIVDNNFTQKIKLRFQSHQVLIDLKSLNAGINRMYYIFQDSSYKIIGMGHGDIQKI